MKPLDIVFFPKGGFSSSNMDDIWISNDVNSMDLTHPNDPTQNDCIAIQFNSRRKCQKSEEAFSTCM